MNRVSRRHGMILSLLLTGLACLSGCESGGHFTLGGYTTRPTFDDSIRTVYVPIAANVSYHRDIEFDLTKAVIRELSANSPYRITSDRNRADTELVMKIINSRKSVILQNPLGEPRDVEIGLFVEVVWRDLRPGHIGDVLSNPKPYDPKRLPLPDEILPPAPPAIPILITPTATYTPELGGSKISAEKRAVEQAARQIIQSMEKWR